jgi:hypothetical protein
MSIRLYDFCFIIFSVLTPPLSAIFQLYHGFRGGRSRSTQREPPTMGKQLVNLINYGQSSTPFLVIYKAGATPY